MNYLRTKIIETLASWKSSLAGLVFLVEAFTGFVSQAFDHAESLQGHWAAFLAAALGILARDNTTPSERVESAKRHTNHISDFTDM